MRITDGNQTVNFNAMKTWNGKEWIDYSPEDFFNAGVMRYDSAQSAYVADDVDYLISQAEDWANCRGDFAAEAAYIKPGSRSVQYDIKSLSSASSEYPNKKSYKEFKKIYIGCSDIASLVFRSVSGTKEIHFGGDGCYDAYEVFGNDVEIGAHYKKVFSGDTWLWIYDDMGRTYDSGYHDGMTVDVYRAAGYGCIIHWHSEDPKESKSNIVQAEDILSV